MRGFKNSYAGGQALLIATGPSADTLDIRDAIAFQRSGGKIFAINRYHLLSIARSLNPNFFVFADPGYTDFSTKNTSMREVWDHVETCPGSYVCLPTNARIDQVSKQCNLLYFNGTGLEGWTRNVSPMRARGYVNLTAFAALSIIQFMGFEKIYMIGVDNDVFRYLELDGDGKLVIGSHHAYSESASPQSTVGLADTMQGALEDYARYFHGLTMFETSKVINLNQNSIIQGIQIGTLPSIEANRSSDRGIL